MSQDLLRVGDAKSARPKNEDEGIELGFILDYTSWTTDHNLEVSLRC
jgi:hypothetical protein